MQNMTNEQKQRMVALIREDQQIEDTLSTWQRDLGGCLDDDYAVIVAHESERTGQTPAQMADIIETLITRKLDINDELGPLMQAQNGTPAHSRAFAEDSLPRVWRHMVRRLRALASEA